ncbi:MAG: type II toxin-antitoxin system RelE/ParE family toxin [Nitrospira sp.]|nr:MAG: type II toxin-antitoxin system RelE/ParE family toxin [Nitrospira sp.]
MTVTVSPQAQVDLKEAYEYVGRDNPDAADRVLAHLVEVIGMLATELIVRQGSDTS